MEIPVSVTSESGIVYFYDLKNLRIRCKILISWGQNFVMVIWLFMKTPLPCIQCCLFLPLIILCRCSWAESHFAKDGGAAFNFCCKWTWLAGYIWGRASHPTILSTSSSTKTNTAYKIREIHFRQSEKYSLQNKRNMVTVYMGPRLPLYHSFYKFLQKDSFAAGVAEKRNSWWRSGSVQEIRKLTKGFSHVSHCRYHIFIALSHLRIFGIICILSSSAGKDWF